MSHWRSHKSNALKDVKMDLLEKACADVGVSFDTSIKSISNSWGNENVDAALKKDGRVLPLGFVFEEREGKTALKLSGDFYDTGLVESQFIDQVAQMYMKHKAAQALEEQSFTVDSIETTPEGFVKINATPWGEF